MDLGKDGFAQAAAFAVGATYLLIGVIGFTVTGFGGFVQDGPDKLIGLDINPFHNVFHMATGAYLMLISQFGRAATEGALIGGGAVYIVAVFLGVTDNLQILSMNGVGNFDNVLHLASGVSAVGIGLASVAANRNVDQRGEPLTG